MRLYMARTYDSDLAFYWAEKEGDAKQMFIKDTNAKPDDEILIEQVWANNPQLEYRGYVTKEN